MVAGSKFLPEVRTIVADRPASTSRVVRAGRTFLRRMIDLSAAVSELEHWVRLNLGFHSHLRWWELFLEDWNGVTMCGSVIVQAPASVVTSDASGRWGCGAFMEEGYWFQFRWPAEWENVHITAKELLPIVVACAVWGDRWQRCTIRCLCDNAAVVAIMRSGSSKDPLVMHLLPCLFFFMAYYQIVSHIPGSLNEAADHLSRDTLPSFLQITPGAKSHPTPLGEELMATLVTQQSDWTSASWRAALRLADSSHRTYKSGENRFLHFCQMSGVSPLPVSEGVLCKFVSYLAGEGLKHRSIKPYLSGVRYLQIRCGYADPFHNSQLPCLDYTMKGVKQVQAGVGWQ